MRAGRVFLISFISAFIIIGVIGGAYYGYEYYRLSREQKASDALASAKKLADGFYVSDQVKLDDPLLTAPSSVKLIIDFRPDGEAPDQPPAAQVETAARKLNMDFFYIPTPHGDIPEANVTALLAALDSSPLPVVMYCRSGNRAARVWALAMATKNDGPPADEIITMVKSNGFQVDDLADQIKTRVAQRTKQ